MIFWNKGDFIAAPRQNHRNDAAWSGLGFKLIVESGMVGTMCPPEAIVFI